MTNESIAKQEEYQVFFGMNYVLVEATSADDAFQRAKATQLTGPFKNIEEQELAVKEAKMTGKVYCPNGDRAIFDEAGLYLPGMMLWELNMHAMLAEIAPFTNELGGAVDSALRNAGGDMRDMPEREGFIPRYVEERRSDS